MPRDSIRSLVMSAEKDAVKRFISHMHRSWDQLQVETSQVLLFKTVPKIRYIPFCYFMLFNKKKQLNL